MRLSSSLLPSLALASLFGGGCSTTSSNPSPVAEATQGEKCDAKEHEKENVTTTADRDTVDADGVVRRGEKLTAGAATAVSAVVAKAKELDGQRVKVAGKVDSVCQHKGCWFVVRGDKAEEKIRMTTKAHNIFVPRKAVGMNATVEGTLTVKTGEGGATELGIDVVGLEMVGG